MPYRHIALLLLLGLAGCAAKGPPAQQTKSAQAGPVLALLEAQYRQWRGVRYRLGGNDLTGIDCSAFVQRTFAERFGVALPRQTEDQARVGRAISQQQLQTGDLVLFKTGWRTRHIGIYLDDKRFLHASTSQGVTISSLQNPYWQAKYWTARRLVIPN